MKKQPWVAEKHKHLRTKKLQKKQGQVPKTHPYLGAEKQLEKQPWIA